MVLTVAARTAAQQQKRKSLSGEAEAALILRRESRVGRIDPGIFLIVVPALAIFGILVNRFGKNTRPGFDHREVRDPSGEDKGFNRRT